MPLDDRRLATDLRDGPRLTEEALDDRLAIGEIGAQAMQIFSDNPTAWQRRAEPPIELAAFRERLAIHDIGPVAIHAAYLVNLAGSDPTFSARSIEVLVRELRGAPSFGAHFVNVHIGSHRDAGVEVGVGRVADAVALALAEVDEGPDAAMLVLENSAGSGRGIGTDVAELAAIAEAIERRGVRAHRVGFCLDTAHAWGAGIDVGDPASFDAFLGDFDARIGLHRLVMLHLNDSRSERGSRLDRHEHLGAGRIGHVGLAHVIRHPDLAHAAYFLETPGMDEGYDAVNLQRAWALAVGEPLAVLPPAAFELRSSRARTAPA